MSKPNFFAVMGASGCGKSAVGSALNATFCEGDDHHRQTNTGKMTQGFPLQYICPGPYW